MLHPILFLFFSNAVSFVEYVSVFSHQLCIIQLCNFIIDDYRVVLFCSISSHIASKAIILDLEMYNVSY